MVCGGLCWPRVGTILGLSWAILGYVGAFWAMLAPYWAHIGPFWAIFGSVSAFAVSLNFRPRSAFAKNTINTKEKTQFLGCVADGFCCYLFVVFVSFFLWHAALRLCLPDLGIMLGHCELCRQHIRLMLSNFGVFCGLSAFVGQELGSYWAYLAPFWAMLGHCGLCRHHIGLMLSHFGVFCGLCWPLLGKSWDHILAMLGHFGPRWHHIWLMLSHFSGILWFVLALVWQELGPYWAYLGPFWAMLGHFWQRWHRIALILRHAGPRWSKDARQTWQEVSQHSSSQRSKDRGTLRGRRGTW